MLSSTLIFTLKSQASNIIPHVGHSIGDVYQDITNTNAEYGGLSFNEAYQNVQKQGWRTGTWGTAKFYVDNAQKMHVGGGQLSGSYTSVADINKIHTISLDNDVQAPQDSSFLFTQTDRTFDHNHLSAINHLNRLDVSQTTNMSNMFFGDSSLRDLDVSHFDTHNVTGDGMLSMFEGDNDLTNLDVSHFDTSHITHDMYGMFANDSSLRNLDVSHFNTYSTVDTDDMFGNDTSLQDLDLSSFDTHWNSNMVGMLQNDNSLNYLRLGKDTKLNNVGLSGTYKQGDQVLSLDGNAHPGTWLHQ